MLLPSGKATIGSNYNSSDYLATTPVSEEGKISDLGMLALTTVVTGERDR